MMADTAAAVGLQANEESARIEQAKKQLTAKFDQLKVNRHPMIWTAIAHVPTWGIINVSGDSRCLATSLAERETGGKKITSPRKFPWFALPNQASVLKATAIHIEAPDTR